MAHSTGSQVLGTRPLTLGTLEVLPPVFEGGNNGEHLFIKDGVIELCQVELL